MRLHGKVAVVTGAARGIGAALAARLSQEGASVALCDRDAGGAQAVAGRLTAGPGRALGFAFDVSDDSGVRAAVERIVGELGPVDVLVNNAGVDRIQPFVDSVPATWDQLIAVNFRGCVTMCHALVPGMVGRRYGRIVTISSDAGRVGSSGEVVYSGTKAAVIGFSKALAREVAAAGVTVNVVCPGPTDTALLDQVAEQSQKRYDALARAIPMRRIGTPDDIAPAVAFFASDDAAYITGQTLSVSGGLTMA